MTTSPNAPRLLKGGIVLLDAESGAVRRVITLQYNSDTVTHTLQVQGTGGEGGNRAEVLRLTGPPVETIKLEAEIDATDQLEFPDQNPAVADAGIQPYLAALEMAISPTSAQLQANNALARSGTLAIIPMQSLLTVFVWGKNRVMPVLITELNFIEEAFHPNLSATRAKISLGLRTLSVNDVGFDHRAGGLFMSYQQRKEHLATRHKPDTLAALGIERVP